MQEGIQKLLAYAEELHEKHLLSETIGPFDYDPGKTEYLAQYDGSFDPQTGLLSLSTEIKGLRYENRSRHLETVSVGDAVELRRDMQNLYNSNNFELFTPDGKTLGSLPAELCNLLAPLYDTGTALIQDVSTSYIEQLMQRSRYAKQGVLFVKILIRLQEAE